MNSKLIISQPKVVVIIPTYNEAGNVPKVTVELNKIFKSLSNYQTSILFVDDQSPDKTAKAILSLRSNYPFVRLLSNKRKLGLGHAYKKGMLYALDRLRADIVFEFDADLSHDPSKIPLMLKELENGADMVLGARYIRGGSIPRHWGIHRKFLSIVGNLFIQTMMFNFRVHDWTSGYRAIKKEVVRKIIPELGSQTFRGYTWQIGFLIKTIDAGFRVKEVPFHFADRTIGKSKLGPEYIFNNLIFILKARMHKILHSRILKFVMVGGFGSLIQLIALHFYRILITQGFGPLSPYQLALILAIETAIVSNFTWSNLWTFRDRKLQPSQIPVKFLQFNLASGGSLLIQFLVASAGERFIGLYTLMQFTWPISFSIDTGLVFAVVGILMGMFWNFFAYSHLVWRKK